MKKKNSSKNSEHSQHERHRKKGFLEGFLSKNEYAKILNDKGEVIRTIPMHKTRNVVHYQDKLFKVNREKDFHITVDNYFRKNVYYFYNYKYSNAVTYSLESGKLVNQLRGFDSTDMNTIFKTEQLKKVNSISKNPFGNIEPKYLIVGLIILGIIVYFLTGGSLS